MARLHAILSDAVDVGATGVVATMIGLSLTLTLIVIDLAGVTVCVGTRQGEPRGAPTRNHRLAFVPRIVDLGGRVSVTAFVTLGPHTGLAFVATNENLCGARNVCHDGG
jgi:hypothetical protein